MKNSTVLPSAPKSRSRTKRHGRGPSASAVASKRKSLVDEMLGIAELRAPAPGTDPLYDVLLVRHAARR